LQQPLDNSVKAVELDAQGLRGDANQNFALQACVGPIRCNDIIPNSENTTNTGVTGTADDGMIRGRRLCLGFPSVDPVSESIAVCRLLSLLCTFAASLKNRSELRDGILRIDNTDCYGFHVGGG
jgi:hypothetical protein